MTISETITVAAVVIRNEAGHVLCVRKHASPYFQLPGGKPEQNESLPAAAVRETQEEVGISLKVEQLRFVGAFDATAANEPGLSLSATVFAQPAGHLLTTTPQARAEIDEVAWVDPSHPGDLTLAPLLSDHVFPALTGHTIRSVAVYAGANPGVDPAFMDLADDVGTCLARHDVTLVYGGSRLGIMGRAAQAALASGGRVVGVLTNELAAHELRYEGITRLEMVSTLAERKARMSQLSDAVIVLPGGAGTLDELFDSWTQQQLGYHTAPIALLGMDFWAPFVAMINHMVAQGLIRPADRASLILADDAEELITGLNNWMPPVPRWL